MAVFAQGKVRSIADIEASTDATRNRKSEQRAARHNLQKAGAAPMEPDPNLVAGLNKDREAAVIEGRNPYRGDMRSYDAYAKANPTVITDATIRDKVAPQIEQDTNIALTKAQQGQAQVQQREQASQQQKNEEAKNKDPMADIFAEKASTIDPYSQAELDLITRAQKSGDSSTRLLADRYKAIYDRQRAQQNEASAIEQGNAGTSLQRLGDRYTPGAAGQVQSQIQRANLEKLAEIDDAEMSAIEELRLAQENKDIQLQGQKLDVLKGIREERIKKLEEIRKDEKDRKDSLEKERNTILKSLGESGAPADVIAAVAGAESVADMVTAAGNNLQTGEYAEYARAVKNAGFTPVDPNTYYAKKIYGENGPPGSDVFGGAVPFEATIDGAAALAGSVTGEKSASEQLKSLAASGDYTSLLTRMESLARKGMGATEGGEVFNAQNQIKSITDLQSVLDEYEAMGGELGPLPATSKALAAKIGQLQGDPRYTELATRMTAAFQKYRQQMSGAAFGVKENEEYKKVIPTGDKDFALNRAVITGLKDFLENNVDNAYETQLGEGYKNVKDYVDQGLTPEGKKLLKTEQDAEAYAETLSAQDPAFEESWANALDTYPELPASEILEILGKPVQVGNKVSVGNRPQRNNNPGNVKIGGLGDQYAKKGPDGKPMTDDEGHLIFATADDGAKAIRADINAKLSGNSPAAQRKLGRQIVTLADLNAVYAEDPNWKNNVAAYAGVSPDTKVNSIPRETLINAIMKAEGFFA